MVTTRSIQLRISGLVQGVSYRATAQDEALRRGLVGWVRNLPTGDVEAFASGPVEAVNGFVEWCHRGPEEARVTGVTVREVDADASVKGFVVRR
jgi:acylphosphatase